MENLVNELNAYYEDYKQNNSSLNKRKEKEIVKFLTTMTFGDQKNIQEVAFQLSRFSAGVTENYFEYITTNKKASVELIDEILEQYLRTNRQANKSQYYVQKFIFAIISVIKNYKNEAFKSSQLPRLVIFIARFAARSDKYKSKYQDLILKTKGVIFQLDYTKLNKNILQNLWNVTNDIYPDLSKTEYKSLIVEWGKEYGFIDNETVAQEVSSNEENNEDEKSNPETSKTTVPNDNELKKEFSDKTNSFSEVTVREFYNKLHEDLSSGQQNIISVISEMINSINKDIDSVKGEISRSREIGAENVKLKMKVDELEHQLSETKEKLQESNQALLSIKNENNNLKDRISVLENENSELDNKLKDAYTLNSRESSLEAEKIRSNLKKAFGFLYEDWLEYEFSDVNEENYESLQAIIKKSFRSLERNGIDFKETSYE